MPEVLLQDSQELTAAAKSHHQHSHHPRTAHIWQSVEEAGRRKVWPFGHPDDSDWLVDAADISEVIWTVSGPAS